MDNALVPVQQTEDAASASESVSAFASRSSSRSPTSIWSFNRSASQSSGERSSISPRASSRSASRA